MPETSIKMRFTRFANLPPLQIPAGYGLRTYQPGDEQRWIDLLNHNGELGEWSDERREREWQGGKRIPPEGLYFVTLGDQPVATACVTLHPDTDDLYELGWVAVEPSQQGKRLGSVVCLAVLHNFAERGCTSAYLLTNDFRLPAIKTYLNLGFEPEYTEPDHPERWRAIFAELNKR